ncbi:hypothetical protein B0H14DRAFT_3709052 [Mycena olivaceomarginata]|nr:hypothetical protein B0H14DRAFT_3709052 [Mycena olivaceomarginata]
MELERIANAPLLILSQVCSRWHGMAIDTPTFWSTVEVSSVSRHCTLDSLCVVRDSTPSIPASSSPWPSTPIDGNVYKWPVLTRSGYVRLDGKIVSSHQARDPRFPETIRAFAIAPRLEKIFSNTCNRSNARFRVCGLRRPALLDGPATPTSAAELQLTFGIDCQNFLQHYASLKRMFLPSIVGRFSAFNVCTTMAKFNARDMATIVERIFASVTATQLQRLVMGCCGYPELALQWPHAEFVACASAPTFLAASGPCA